MSMNTLPAAHSAPPPPPLAEDRICGIRAIASFLGAPQRHTHYLIQRQLIPTVREGRNIVSFKSWLVQHYENRRPTSAAPTADRPRLAHTA
jgi:hypothetical protein